MRLQDKAFLWLSSVPLHCASVWILFAHFGIAVMKLLRYPHDTRPLRSIDKQAQPSANKPHGTSHGELGRLFLGAREGGA